VADRASDPIDWIPPALAAVGRDFPLLERGPDGVPRVYLDNATTALMPRVVRDEMTRHAGEALANEHRGVPWLNQRAAAACEDARTAVRQFFNAAQSREIVFVGGTTEAIDLVARSYGSLHIGRDDEVILSIMDHQANMAPWQALCARHGAHIRIIPMSDTGELDLDAYEGLLNDRTRIVAVPHVSNVLGTINPIAEMVRLAHRRRPGRRAHDGRRAGARL
jgi:cysteine desulfurase/selenocysteine lyase